MKYGLRNVPKKDHFVVVDGTVLKNLKDLQHAIINMEEESFKHHVNASQHDFHDWVKNAHKDAALASQLLKAQDQKSAAAVLHKRVQKIQAEVLKERRQKQQRVATKSGKPLVRSVRKGAQFKAGKHHFITAPPSKFAAGQYQTIAGTVAAVLIIIVVGLTSHASSITGAAVASVGVGEVQALGMGGIIAIIALFLLSIVTIQKHHRKMQK